MKTVSLTLVLSAAAVVVTLQGCAALVLGGAVAGGAMVATDRRTTGTQVEDQGIEIKGMVRGNEVSPAGHVSVTSYNRMVLITGEVPSENDRKAVEVAVGRIENVRSVVNELAVMGNTSLAQRSNDSVLSGKVKASFIDAKDVHAHALKVISERGVVYLMGRVTERESNRAAEIARAVSGVQKVVRVFETISEAELAEAQPRSVPR